MTTTEFRGLLRHQSPALRVGIVGGGPSGLITAYYLRKLISVPLQITLFEASSRLGGKISTLSFDSVGARYEAGVAELYNYRVHGEDPLRDLVDELGLKTITMVGGTVVLGDTILNSMGDIRKAFGRDTANAIQDFFRSSRDLCSPHQFYADDWEMDNQHCWSERTLREMLNDIPDEVARRYVEVAIRSDVASEPHLTNGLTGLKNILMEDAKYMSVYSIAGGIERLVDGLKNNIDASVRLDSRVESIARRENGYRVRSRYKQQVQEHDFDLVICALPNYWLASIEWPDKDLRPIMQEHLAHYDRPAHYLRITLLFQKPFWRSLVKGSYFMHDAFGGCCVYDEGSRHPNSDHGVLGWLLAGNDALIRANLSDEELTQLALDSLPAPLLDGRRLFLEARIHRWVGTVNALPGGNPIHDLDKRHSPSSADPNLYLVGDYLFDSTLNGVVDSAEYVSASIAEDFNEEPTAVLMDGPSSQIGEFRERA